MLFVIFICAVQHTYSRISKIKIIPKIEHKCGYDSLKRYGMPASDGKRIFLLNFVLIDSVGK